MFAIVFLVAMMISGWTIGSKELWIDEICSVTFTESLESLREWLDSSGGASWLYYLLLWPWNSLVDSDAWLRFPSALFASVAAGTTMLLGTRIAGRTCGLVAAVVLMTNVMFVGHAQEVRMYTLAIALISINGVMVLAAVRRQVIGFWIISGALAFLCLGAHYFSALAWGAQWLGALLCWPRESGWRGPLLAAALATAGGVAHLAVFDVFGTSLLPYLAEARLSDLVVLFSEILGTRWKLVALSGCALAAAVGIATYTAARSTTGVTQLRGGAWILTWLILPPLLLLCMSLVLGPLFNVRYLTPILPAFALLAGWSIANLPARWLGVAVLACVLAAQARGVQLWYAKDVREGWRGAAQYVDSNARREEPLIFFRWFMEPALRRYSGISAADQDLLTANFARPGMAEAEIVQVLWEQRRQELVAITDLRDAMKEQGRKWLVLAHDTWSVPDGDRTRDRLMQVFADHESCGRAQFQRVRVLCLEPVPAAGGSVP